MRIRIKTMVQKQKTKEQVTTPSSINRRDYIFAVLSGLLYFLSFPKYGNFVCAWLFLLPLFFALKNKNTKDALKIGFIAGFIGSFGVVHWIIYSVHFYGKVNIVLSVLIILLLAAYMSIYFIAFSAVTALFLRRQKIALVILSIPVAWVCLEYIKSRLFAGFPWENLGYSQYEILPLIQFADVIGVYGISFLIVFVSTIIFTVISAKEKIAIKTAYIFGAVALIVVLIGYGCYRLDSFAQMAKQIHAEVEVSLVQGNIPQDVKWEPHFQSETMQAYRTLSKYVPTNNTRLIIWPETAMPFFLQDEGIYQRIALETIRKAGAWAVIGAPGYVFEGRTKYSVTNSAFVVSPQGTTRNRYDKVHLVPFGEYVPSLIPFVTKMVADIGDIKEGVGYIPVALGNISAGILVCYEAIFPEISREYARQNVDVLINITNDGWFGKTSASYQHLSMVALRAVETRRHVLRAANTGITAIIDPTGKIVASTEIFERTRLDRKIKLAKMDTVYTRIGDLFVYINFALLMWICFAMRRKKD